MDSQIKWLWKLSSSERQYRIFTVSYRLTLATREPLEEDLVTRALTHLFRKVSLLRTCFGCRDGETWLREMSQEILDFKVVTNGTIPEINRAILAHRYNVETGPLWCVRLMAESPSSPEIPPGFNASEFPHLHTLFLGLNHSITDGTSNMRICGFLVQLLDAVIGGKAVDDEEQLGEFVSSEKTQNILKEKIASLEADPLLRSGIVEEIQSRQKDRSLLKSIYKGDKVPRTEVLEDNLDADTTLAFVKRCRSEAVTVNSAFAALATTAVVDLLLDAGLDQESYNIRCDHVFNARRYWGGDTSMCLGPHVLPPTTVVLNVPKNVSKRFWDFARMTHNKLQEKINGGALLEEAAKHFLPPNPEYDAEYEFGLSNMGSVTQLVTEGGSHVQALHVTRSVAVHEVPITWILFIHSFRDRLAFAVNFTTAFLNAQLARKFCDRIFFRLRQVIQKWEISQITP